MFCPKCGSNVDGYASCPRCGAPIGASQPGYASSQPQGNHVKILVFGILSLALAGVVGLIFSFVTLSMSGKYFATYGNVSNQVRIGRKLAIAGIILSVFMIIFYVILIVWLINDPGQFKSIFEISQSSSIS